MTVDYSRTVVSTDEYDVRAFQSGDEAAFLTLYNEVFDSDRESGWLDWKYRSNPYIDDNPIIVAEHDGHLVGARPFFPLRLRIGGQNRLALQPADAMVHPDHRRRGLFTRMTEVGLNRYRDRPALFFNFPNHQSLPGNLALGWGVVGELPAYYRIQDAGALVRSETAGLRRVATTCLSGVVRTGLRVSEHVASVPTGISVTHRRSVPARPLAMLSGDHPTDGIQAVRNELFYNWRFGQSPRRYRTYLAERSDGPVCAVVVTETHHGGAHLTQIVDTAPVSFAGTGPRRRAALRAALLAVVHDARQSAAIVAPGMPFPSSTMVSLGFLPRSTPVLARVTNESAFVARSNDGFEGNPSQTVAGVHLLDQDAWNITFAEHDNR